MSGERMERIDDPFHQGGDSTTNILRLLNSACVSRTTKSSSQPLRFQNSGENSLESYFFPSSYIYKIRFIFFFLMKTNLAISKQSLSEPLFSHVQP